MEIIGKFSEIAPQTSVLQVNAFPSAAIDEDINSIAYVRDKLLKYDGTKFNASESTNESWLRSDGSRPLHLGYLQSHPDPEDCRRKLLSLAYKGTALHAELS